MSQLPSFINKIQILDEPRLALFDADGTLWENDHDLASCNHGFASHAVHVLYRDVLGLARVDTVRKQVLVRFSDVKLDWCSGAMPVPEGRVELNWRRENGKLVYDAHVPAGYTLSVENAADGK